MIPPLDPHDFDVRTVRGKMSKLLRAHPTRRTRFHNARGQLMPARAWLQLPRSLADRIGDRKDHVPWIVPAATNRLESLISHEWKVLEFGSGSSTVWYASRAGHVTSIEDDERWFEKVNAMLLQRGLTNVDVRLSSLERFLDHLGSFADESLDLVVVDGNDGETMDRMRCLAAVRRKIRPGGYILLDDSDRAEYSGADALLPGWSIERFVGVKPTPLTAVETTLYRHAGPSRFR